MVAQVKAVAKAAAAVASRIAKKYGVRALRASCRFLESEVASGNIKESYGALSSTVKVSRSHLREDIREAKQELKRLKKGIARDCAALGGLYVVKHRKGAKGRRAFAACPVLKSGKTGKKCAHGATAKQAVAVFYAKRRKR